MASLLRPSIVMAMLEHWSAARSRWVSASIKTMPGTAADRQYEIRSIDQLQYMNWNCVTQDAATVLETGTDFQTNVTGYVYLGYMYSTYGNKDTITDNIIKLSEMINSQTNILKKIFTRM